MSLALIAAGIAGAAGITKSIIGGFQRRKGQRIQDEADANREDYTIPQEMFENVALAKQRGLQGLPEAQKAQYINNLQQQQAYALQQTGSRKGGLTGIAANNRQQQMGYQNLLAQDASARMQNQREVYSQNLNLAKYRNTEYEANILVPYYEKTAQAQALMGSGMQNVAGGLQSLGTSAASMIPGLSAFAEQRGARNAGNAAAGVIPQAGAFDPTGGFAGGYNGQILTNTPSVGYNPPGMMDQPLNLRG